MFGVQIELYFKVGNGIYFEHICWWIKNTFIKNTQLIINDVVFSVKL